MSVQATTGELSFGASPDSAGPAIDVGTGTSDWVRSGAKRALDLTLALPLAILTVPILLVLLVVSAVVFRSNPLFIQERIGLRGSRFSFVKLRSMPASVPADIDKYALGDHSGSLGRFSRFVRTTHLDELPQLWQVVSGQMSLVGPRPELPAIAERFDPDFVERRVRVRPGVTGLWQISESSNGLIGESPVYDDLYVSSGTFRTDLWVMGRTVAGFLGAPAATEFDCRRVVRG